MNAAPPDSASVVAAPRPHKRIRECLLENAAVAVTRGKAEYEAVVVTFGLERSRGAFAGHHPVVMGFLRVFRAKIVFGHVGEDARRLLLTGFNELHARMIFPWCRTQGRARCSCHRCRRFER